MITHDPRWSLTRGNTLVLSRWQATSLLSTKADDNRNRFGRSRPTQVGVARGERRIPTAPMYFANAGSRDSLVNSNMFLD